MKKNFLVHTVLKTAENDESGKISGYASTYNNPDLAGDVMLPGCYDAVLNKIKSSGVMPVMFFSHDHWSVPCGTWDEINSDEKGLYVSGRINRDLESGKEIYSALKFGSLSGLSVGFSFSPEGVEDNDAGGYDFKAIDDLMEISICAMPCNQSARIDAVKSLDVESITDYKTAERYLRDAGDFSREQAKKFISCLKAVFTSERDAILREKSEKEIINLIHKYTKV
mgnify:CR=1 FL=1